MDGGGRPPRTDDGSSALIGLGDSMTDIPPVNEKYTGSIGEVVLGKGDYIVGGAKGMPFLSFLPVRNVRRPALSAKMCAHSF